MQRRLLGVLLIPAAAFAQPSSEDPPSPRPSPETAQAVQAPGPEPTVAARPAPAPAPTTGTTTDPPYVEVTAKVLLVADGVVQAAGIVGMIGGALQPAAHPAATPSAKLDTKLHLRPTMIRGSPGISVSGRF